jgi:hypothetical protein
MPLAKEHQAPRVRGEGKGVAKMQITNMPLWNKERPHTSHISNFVTVSNNPKRTCQCQGAMLSAICHHLPFVIICYCYLVPEPVVVLSFELLAAGF